MMWTTENGESQLKMLYNNHKGWLEVSEWINVFVWYWLTRVVLDTGLINRWCHLYKAVYIKRQNQNEVKMFLENIVKVQQSNIMATNVA